MMRPQFARDQVSDLDLEERHVQHMMSALDRSIQANGWTNEIDLQVLFFRLTLDSATEFLFGESVDSQLRLQQGYEPTKEDALSSDFASAFDKGQMGLATRARFAEMYWVVNTKTFRNSCELCHEFIDRFVRLALSKELQEKDLQKDASGKKEKYVFLEALAQETQDPIELRSQLLNILLAGRDTTASLLGWLFHCLVRDPARYKKLRDIIIAEFGTYEHPSEITFSKLKSCRYLQHCNNEALRLYPVVPVNARYANKDTTIPRGGGKDGNSPIFVPKGTSVEYSVHTMHRRKDVWGLDADEFRPERWENRKVGWEYLPVSLLSCALVQRSNLRYFSSTVDLAYASASN
jgi:cytochrome P450